MPDLSGSVYVEVMCAYRVALSSATAGWSDQEKQALIDGDQEAKDELFRHVAYEARRVPDDQHIEVKELQMREGRSDHGA